ncbi:MAG TPA: isoprenylcysteine carboxylmethyltransferase family protein [Anaerolineae bacterium]|nr:isoprenylcysteine carboxylmethyltransferase family protein [Anaerolineae bacterium]
MKEKLLRQAGREYAPWQRLLALAALAPVFLLFLPLALIRGAARLDQALHLPRLPGGRALQMLGGLMTVAGWLLGMWSNAAEFELGRGTPVPLMATQRLVVEPPFTYTRNPMALGAILMYLGVALLRRSLAGVGIVLTAAAALLVYIKRVEEHEMVARFGQEYLAYRERTPFLLPRLMACRNSSMANAG